MINKYLFELIIIFLILFRNTGSYIVIPLKSTYDLYFSKLSKDYISINSSEIINQIYFKYIHNVLYTDLTIGEPNQKATAFISHEKHGFLFYEEFSTEELKELGYTNYNKYSTNESNTINPTDEINYDFSFWSYFSYEEILYLNIFNDKDIFNPDKFNDINKKKTEKGIHFLYAKRNSSKIPNTEDFINMEKKYQKEKEELRKLNFTDFSYFSLGLQLDSGKAIHGEKSFIEEFYSKKEISSKDWSIYFIKNKKRNRYDIFLILGSIPHIYLSNIFNEKQQYSTYSDKNVWSYNAVLSFKDIYTQINDTNISLVDSETYAIFNYNFGLIRATWYVKTNLENIYFNNLIKQGKCFESKLYKTEYTYYGYYYCDKNKITNEEIKKFPTIYFKHIFFSKVFELNADDLFETFGDIIIFKMVFDTSTHWMLGQVFLSKYMFSFNTDNKKIYFYNKNIKIDEKGNIEPEPNNENKYLILQIILIIVCVIAFSIIGFFIGKCIYKRKIVAHELKEMEEDNFIENNNNDTNDNERRIIP